MRNIKIFENTEFGRVRSVLINDELYFVGKDIAKILGYRNSRKAIIDHVDEEDKTDGVTIWDSIGRKQNPIMINESGLYSLIFSSKLPSAKVFKHWVTSEVIPSIRKHSMYAVDDILRDPAAFLKAVEELNKEREKSAVQKQQAQRYIPIIEKNV